MRAVGLALAGLLVAGAAHAQDDCVVGRWVADDAALAAAIAAVDPTAPAPSVSGEAIFDYAADGALRLEMTGFVVVAGLSGTDQTVTIATEGVDEAHWAAADGHLRLTPRIRGATVTVTVGAVGGGEPGTVDMKGWLETNNAAYACEDVLEVDLPLGGGGRAVTWVFTRVAP